MNDAQLLFRQLSHPWAGNDSEKLGTGGLLVRLTIFLMWNMWISVSNIITSKPPTLTQLINTAYFAKLPLKSVWVKLTPGVI